MDALDAYRILLPSFVNDLVRVPVEPGLRVCLLRFIEHVALVNVVPGLTRNRNWDAPIAQIRSSKLYLTWIHVICFVLAAIAVLLLTPSNPLIKPLW